MQSGSPLSLGRDLGYFSSLVCHMLLSHTWWCYCGNTHLCPVCWGSLWQTWENNPSSTPKALNGVRQGKKTPLLLWSSSSYNKYPLCLWLLQETRHTAQRPTLEKIHHLVSAVTLLSLVQLTLNSQSCGFSCTAFFSAQSPSAVNSKCCQDPEPGPCALSGS